MMFPPIIMSKETFRNFTEFPQGEDQGSMLQFAHWASTGFGIVSII